MRYRVFKQIERPNVVKLVEALGDAGQDLVGITNHELAFVLNKDSSSITPRVSELLKAKWIKASDTEPDRPFMDPKHGYEQRAATVWIPTPWSERLDYVPTGMQRWYYQVVTEEEIWFSPPFKTVDQRGQALEAEMAEQQLTEEDVIRFHFENGYAIIIELPPEEN